MLDIDNEIIKVVKGFQGYSFSTYKFSMEFKREYSGIWCKLVDKYGEGGKGGGTQYSVYSYLSHKLNRLYKLDKIHKLDYRKAPPEYGNPLIRYWSENKYFVDFPDEIDDSEDIAEGAKSRVVVNKYERDQVARQKCIEIYGLSCVVCGFNFEEKYGSLGAGFIHVHHLKPLSEIGESYIVNPKNDLRPVCPNCHAMLHRNKYVIEIKDLKEKLSIK